MVRGTVGALPFRHETFDAVIGSMFMHHVTEAERASVSCEAYRVLRRGWLAIITVSHRQIADGVLARNLTLTARRLGVELEASVLVVAATLGSR